VKIGQLAFVRIAVQLGVRSEVKAHAAISNSEMPCLHNTFDAYARHASSLTSLASS
jgi:hypothetical protein